MRAYCAAKPGAWPDFPWEEHTHPVFKVGPGERGKIFAFLGGSGVGVKAGRSREVADEWLQRYPGSATVMAYIGRSGLERPRLRRHPRRRAARGGRRVLPAGRRGLPKKLRPEGWDALTSVAADAQASSGFSWLREDRSRGIASLLDVADGTWRERGRLGGLARLDFGGSRAFACLRSSFSIRPSMIDCLLAPTRRRFPAVGMSTKIGQMKRVAGHEPDRPADQVRDQEAHERLAAASRGSTPRPVRWQVRRATRRRRAGRRASAMRSRRRGQQVAVRLGRVDLRGPLVELVAVEPALGVGRRRERRGPRRGRGRRPACRRTPDRAGRARTGARGCRCSPWSPGHRRAGTDPGRARPGTRTGRRTPAAPRPRRRRRRRRAA